MKIVKKDEIYRRMGDRLDIREGEPIPGANSLLEVIRPVQAVDKFLEEIEINTLGQFNLNDADTTDVYTVPQGKRYTFYAISLARASGDRTLDALYVTDVSGGTGIRIANQTAAASLHTELLGIPVVLDQGNTIRASVTGGTNDTTWNVNCYVIKEDAF